MLVASDDAEGPARVLSDLDRLGASFHLLHHAARKLGPVHAVGVRVDGWSSLHPIGVINAMARITHPTIDRSIPISSGDRIARSARVRRQ
jgi:hypothetical protein